MDTKIITLWPTVVEFCADLGLKDTSHARMMRHRGKIPERHRTRILEAAKKRGIEIPVSMLTRLS